MVLAVNKKILNGSGKNPPDKWGLRELIWKRTEGFEEF
jgi:hypothetical protein